MRRIDSNASGSTPSAEGGATPTHRREGGIALAFVLVIIFLMITAVYTFSRRAIINVNIAQNRNHAAEADALARGGLRLAEAAVYLVRLKDQAGDAADALPPGIGDAVQAAAGVPSEGDAWERLGDVPIDFGGGTTLKIDIEEVGAKLNLNALVAQTTSDDDAEPSRSETEEAVEYLVQVLRHIIEGIEGAAEERIYDERALAENLIDYMDADDSALTGRSEDDYYQRQDPPYRPRNGPFLSFEEIGLVEGVDAKLLKVMRDYLTVYPIGARGGIDINRAPPWVLPLVYSGPSGDRELLPERDVRRILSLRQKGKLLCTDTAKDPERCVTLSEAGLDEGSVYPAVELPLPVSVFRVVAEARVGTLSRKLEAIYDTRPEAGPQMLSFRRLRGSE